MAAITITDEAVRLDDPSDTRAAAIPVDRALIFRNMGDGEDDVIWIDTDPDVTAETGAPVYAGEWSPSFALGPGDQVWAVCADGIEVEIRTVGDR